jgi:hypothetical protein
MAYHTERDLEDVLYMHCEKVLVTENDLQVEQWLTRQLTVPSGRIDLLGIVRKENEPDGELQLVIVELKNRPAKSEDILQVTRYAEDIRGVFIGLKMLKGLQKFPKVHRLLIAPGYISDQILFEANSVDVEIRSFSSVGGFKIDGLWEWTEDAENKMIEKYFEISNHRMFNIFIDEANNAIQQFQTIVDKSTKEGNRNG